MNLYTVYDGERHRRLPACAWAGNCATSTAAVWMAGGQDVLLRYNESVCQQKLDFAGPMAEHGAGKLYLRIFLRDAADGRTLSEDTVFLTAPRNMNLPQAPVLATVAPAGDVGAESGEFDVTFQSEVFQHRVDFGFDGLSHRADDNFFDLYPGEARTVRVRVAAGLSAGDLESRLRALSLAGSY